MKAQSLNFVKTDQWILMNMEAVHGSGAVVLLNGGWCKHKGLIIPVSVFHVPNGIGTFHAAARNFFVLEFC